jgi:23S rRNA (uracil1939-C5)-methyltransferase
MNTDIELTIDRIGSGGDGIAMHDGKPVYVANAAPEDKVLVRLGQKRGEGVEGKLLRVIAPSPLRQQPPCKNYERCGGCSVQHLTAAAVQQWKSEQVRISLERFGVVPEIWHDPVFVPDGTRRRATFAASYRNKNLRLGYHAARSHDIADLPDCLVLTPILQKLLQSMRPYLPRLMGDGKTADIFAQDIDGALDVLITGINEPKLSEREAAAEMMRACGLVRLSWRKKERDEPETILQQAPVLKRSGILSVELLSGAFLQPSREGEAALVNAVLRNIDGDKHIIADLFAGCGTFSGVLLQKGKVHAVEGDGAAVKALGNAARHASGLTVEKRDLFREPLSVKELQKFDVVVFDPPRVGASAQAAQIAKSAVPLVIAVSCNPATLARDGAALFEGGYRAMSAQLIDQFSWSAHSEMVAVFQKK